MSNFQKDRILPAKGAVNGTAVRLVMQSVALRADINYEKQIVVNPGTEAEEVYSIGNVSESKSLNFNPNSDEQLAALTNLNQDGKALILAVDTAAQEKHALNGIPDAVAEKKGTASK